MMRSTCRTVRLCAKDALWGVPVFGNLLNMMGAVPVYRTRDHGADARKKNEQMYTAVHETLAAGDMIGIAPEGTSRFLPFMAKLRTGPARIALGAVSRMLPSNPKFCVKICPCGLTYTHREKFRSDVSIVYGKPIVVDASWLEGNGKYDDYEVAVRDLTIKIDARLREITINAPNWEIITAAMTAARIHRPLGTKISLTAYLQHLRGWVEMLKPVTEDGGRVVPLDKDAVYVKTKLMEYQSVLDSKGIKDARVHATEQHGAIPKYVLISRMVKRFFLCALLFSCAIPGLVLWAPVWLAIKWGERCMMAKGPRWNDSVAEMKMRYGFSESMRLRSWAFCGWSDERDDRHSLRTRHHSPVL